MSVASRGGPGSIGPAVGGACRVLRKPLEGTHRKKYALPTGAVLTYRPDGRVCHGREAAYGPGWNRLEYELECLQAAVMDRVEKDSRYKKALASRSACMRKRGHPYDDLQDPRRELAGAIGRTGGKDRASRALGRRELRTAADDYACERVARLHKAVYEAQRVARNSLLDSSARADIRRYRALKRSALARRRQLPVPPGSHRLPGLGAAERPRPVAARLTVGARQDAHARTHTPAPADPVRRGPAGALGGERVATVPLQRPH